MAVSFSHKFGQIIGDVLESTISSFLGEFASKHGLYLDKKGERLVRTGKKVTWTDLYGNAHDLDFVLERDGSDSRIGTPVAFIESAWRRYTKHSRNKVQEIQGAVQTLALTYRTSCPFVGAVLAGVFTDGALKQLRSLGFHVLYFPYESILEAFTQVGIDASFGERTPEREFRTKIRQWNALAKKARTKVSHTLVAKHQPEIEGFLLALDNSVSREVRRILVIPLHGAVMECDNVNVAMEFIAGYRAAGTEASVYRYEIQILYTNGDKVTAEFGSKEAAIDYLGKC